MWYGYGFKGDPIKFIDRDPEETARIDEERRAEQNVVSFFGFLDAFTTTVVSEGEANA